MESFDTILGKGYAGYAKINDLVVALLGSSVDESDNLHQSKGAQSGNVVAVSTGQVPHRNRRSLSIGLVSELDETSIWLMHQTTFDWRNQNFFAKYVTAEVVLANGEGYYCPEAYVDGVTLSVPEDGVGTISFQLTAWTWTTLVGHTTPRSQKAATFFNNSNYQPIPQWNTRLIHSGMPGVGGAYATALSFTLKFSNQWQFKHLLEATSLPPTPRIVFSGRLAVDLQMEVLAIPNTPPRESGGVSVFLGGGRSGMNTTTQTRIDIPLMYRHPQRSYQGLGHANELIRWSSAWYALGAAPSWS